MVNTQIQANNQDWGRGERGWGILLWDTMLDKGMSGLFDEPVTMSLLGGWGLDAMGLYQPQVPGQEEELQELRDSGAGPVHGNSQLFLYPLPSPCSTMVSDKANPATIDSRISGVLEPLPYLTPTKASKPCHVPHRNPTKALCLLRITRAPPFTSPLPPGGEGTHLSGLHHGWLPD